jgi:hypothetical protein
LEQARDQEDMERQKTRKREDQEREDGKTGRREGILVDGGAGQF